MNASISSMPCATPTLSSSARSRAKLRFMRRAVGVRAVTLTAMMSWGCYSADDTKPDCFSSEICSDPPCRTLADESCELGRGFSGRQWLIVSEGCGHVRFEMAGNEFWYATRIYEESTGMLVSSFSVD